MITFGRSSVKRLETTLVSYSRQSLPRPARLFSTPSKPRNAPTAFAAQTATAPAQMPPFASDLDQNRDMQNFLKRRSPYTILPTPLPHDQSSSLNDYYFTDSPTQDSLAVIDACIHGLYDVPRAKEVFEELKHSKKAEALIDIRLYNSLLEAYIGMASTKDKNRKIMWMEEAWSLFDSLEFGRVAVKPNANTYALMLIAWIRFNPESSNPVKEIKMRDPTAILRGIVNREIPVSNVIASRAIPSDEEATEIIKLLSKTAIDMHILSVISELGQTQSLGSKVLPDPLDGVPEAIPVMRIKQKDVEIKYAEDGTILDVVEDKGPPEKEIPFNLDTLRKHLAQLSLARRVLTDDVFTRQKLLEDSVYEVARERLQRQAELFEELGVNDSALKTAQLQRWMWDWHQKLQGRLKVEIDAVIKAEEKTSMDSRLGPFLSLVSPEKLSLITILELMRLQGTGGVIEGMKTARALLTVGKAIELEHKAQMCKKNNIQLPSNTHRIRENNFFTNSGYQDLHARRVTARKYMEDSEEWAVAWTQTLRVKIGSFLVDALMDVATIIRTTIIRATNEEFSEEQPAFYHSYEYVRGQKLGVIRLNPAVADRISRDTLKDTLHPRQLPMLVRPKPWISYDQGGYIYSHSYAMRFKESQEQQMYLKHASELGNLELVYAGLDVLGSTPWMINRKVFDVVLQVWNSEQRLGKIPPADFEIPEPEKPENYETDPKARMIYLMRQKAWNEGKANNHSDRCNVNYKIEIARAFLGDTFYLPHSLDFRGRAYPIPPHLSHIGDDLSRGLLLFAEAKPLGERGLRWLKIHISNLYGFDKSSFDERVKFTDDCLADIYDSAVNPLDGKGWWRNADDPWQCLAACIELRSALESEDPFLYESAFPVHQDGTCNGLQHYAALGGDKQGAQQVNLGVTDRPSDVYTYVANMVQEKVAADASNNHTFAQLLVGKISRKVVKQTVMTTVYGVTFVGAREQIEKQLKDKREIPEELCWTTASYLAKVVMACIGDLFTGAQDIQNWLNLCARLISKSIPGDRLPMVLSPPKATRKKPSATTRLKQEQMTAVVWTTPLGLPIVQPYRTAKRKQVATSLQTVYISDPNSPATVNSAKQASAFPPNFIHSLDATHMMLTALECRSQGLTFASVHDSYWTHACTIDQMSTIIRETFVALHSSDLLGKLHAEFLERYSGYKIPISAFGGSNLLTKLTEWSGKDQDAIKVSVVEQVETMPSSPTSEGQPKTTRDDLLDVLDQAIGGDAFSLDNAEEEDFELQAEDMNDDEEFVDVDPPSPKRKKRTSKASMLNKLAENTPTGENSFIEVTKLIPPVPKKGDFEVETIKESLYFFS